MKYQHGPVVQILEHLVIHDLAVVGDVFPAPANLYMIDLTTYTSTVTEEILLIAVKKNIEKGGELAALEILNQANYGDLPIHRTPSGNLVDPLTPQFTEWYLKQAVRVLWIAFHGYHAARNQRTVDPAGSWVGPTLYRY